MKKLFFTFLLCVFSVISEAQTSQAFSVFIGDSWARGLIGVEYQYELYEISVGYVGAKLPTDQIMNSICIAATRYLKTWDYSSPYFSVAYSSQGFIGVNSYIVTLPGIPIIPTSYNIVPSTILLAGYKFRLENAVNFKVGAGISVSDEGGRLEFDIQLAVPIFHNKNYYRHEETTHPGWPIGGW